MDSIARLARAALAYGALKAEDDRDTRPTEQRGSTHETRIEAQAEYEAALAAAQAPPPPADTMNLLQFTALAAFASGIPSAVTDLGKRVLDSGDWEQSIAGMSWRDSRRASDYYRRVAVKAAHLGFPALAAEADTAVDALESHYAALRNE